MGPAKASKQRRTSKQRKVIFDDDDDDDDDADFPFTSLDGAVDEDDEEGKDSQTAILILY